MVVQYSKEGVLLNEYESAAEASRQTNINSNVIRNVCQGKGKLLVDIFGNIKKVIKMPINKVIFVDCD